MRKIKVAALMLAVMMLLTACNIVNVTEVASINGESVSKGEFMYYLMMGQNAATQAAQQQGDTLESEEDWETVMIEGVSAKQYAKDQALKQLEQVMAAYAKAKSEGFALDEEGKAALAEQKEAFVQQGGGTYEYEAYYNEIGISTAELNTIIERIVYSSQYISKYEAEHEEELTSATDEEIAKAYNEEYVTVKHILFKFPEAAQGEELATTEAEGELKTTEEVKALAEDVLAKVKAGEDFDALMNEYSEDSRDEAGKLANPEGYFVKKDGTTYVKAFTDAAWTLKNVGDYTTELVETEYGYHILKRYANPTSGETYETNVETVKTDITTGRQESLLKQWAEEFNFTTNDKVISRIKLL